jgi:hypothetical protein
MKNKILLLILFILSFPVIALTAGEKNDTIQQEKKKKVKVVPLTPYHWNVIKFNPTPMLINGLEIRNLTFAYERLVTKTQSISLQVGFLVFPKVGADTLLNLIAISSRKKQGVNLALDYRYYPFSRNRRPAPDGLYLGGFVSYYGFHWINEFDILHTTVDQNGKLDGRINVVNIGVELGYQFIFWKRFSLDLLLFGPSLSMYSGSLNISGALDPEQIKNLDQDMVQKILNRFPYLKSIFSEEGLSFEGKKTNWGTGFRYSISLGVHF